VAGGFYGKLGNVVIDSISSPTEVIGIADGYGGLIRKKYSLSDKKKLQIIKSWIKKNN
jgi:6-phosphofructokinase